jgi:hypothetical protein
MLYTLADIEEYFRLIGTAHPGIQQVVIGDSEEVLSVDRSTLNYPLLWLETPDVTWSLRNMQREYSIAFVVLVNAQTDNWQRQRYILNQSLQITESLLARMAEDANVGQLFSAITSAQSDPILGYGHDHDFGWRTTLRMEVPMNACADCALPATLGWAYFTWENASPGNFNVMTLADESRLDELTWATAWSWQVDGAEITTSSEMPDGQFGAGKYLKLWKIMTSGSITRIASAFIEVQERCGESVPYLIEEGWQ